MIDAQSDQNGSAAEAEESAPQEPKYGPGVGPARLQCTIRILANGDVVFGDLPEGLLDVARILAGTDDVIASHEEIVPDDALSTEVR